MTNNLSMRETKLISALAVAANELFRCAGGYISNAANQACAIRDFLRRIDSDMEGGGA